MPDTLYVLKNTMCGVVSIKIIMLYNRDFLGYISLRLK